jgi:translocator protein
MDWGLFAIFLCTCVGAAATGSLFPPGKWYESLSKPTWTPPNWLFPVAWTALYLAIAVAAARVAPLQGSAYAMAFWALQIVLNTLWTPVFFGLRRLRIGLVVIGALWLSVAATAGSMWALDPVAGWLIVAYLAWVTYAAALNLSIVLRNRAIEHVNV